MPTKPLSYRTMEARDGTWGRTRSLRGPLPVRQMTAYLREHRAAPLVGCEVGVLEGLHALALLETLPNLTKLYLVDPYLPYEGEGAPYAQSRDMMLQAYKNAVANLKPYWSRILWRAPLHPVDFAYIDGCHTYDAVMRDIETFWPRIREGGLLGGHDYAFGNGVAQAVDTWARRNGHQLAIRECGAVSDWWVVKDNG